MNKQLIKVGFKQLFPFCSKVENETSPNIVTSLTTLYVNYGRAQ